MLVSELAGRSNVLAKAAELGLDLRRPGPGRAGCWTRSRRPSTAATRYEAADASFELLVRRSAGVLPTWFELEGYRVVIERAAAEADRSEAIVRLRLGADRVVAVGEGVGPVHALDQALRRGLAEVYPALADIRLVDYKVRILDGRDATRAVTRVMLTSADDDGEWTTVGVSDDIVTASWEALADGVAYGLLRAGAAAIPDDQLSPRTSGTPACRAAEPRFGRRHELPGRRCRGRGPARSPPGRPARPARAMLRAVGLSEEDLERPQVAVASSWNEVTPCNVHLNGLAAAAKEGVRQAGAVPLEFGTIAVSDGISMGTEGMKASLVSREIIADSVELMMNAERFDALVAIAGCDKSLPGMLMACARLNVPVAFLYGGTILPGHALGRSMTIQDVFEAVGGHAAGDDVRRRPAGRRAGGVSRRGLVRRACTPPTRCRPAPRRWA